MKQKAFTLIELLVVIVIIGILATISTATFKNSIDKGHQGKSYALQSQVNTLIQGDCLLKGYECGKNIVTNWAFSEGDLGAWKLTDINDAYTIDRFKLTHEVRIPGSTAVDYITVPLNEPMVNGRYYRVDVVAREIETNGVSSSLGFSTSGGIGINARVSSNADNHICDVFRFTGSANRLYVRAGVEVSLDEVSMREVIGYTDISNNNDCAIDGFEEQS